MSRLRPSSFGDVLWAAYHLEKLGKDGVVAAHVRNERMGFTIPYDFQGIGHAYTPDFLVRMRSGDTLILEVKGRETEQDRQKHEAARRWVAAVNNWGEMGHWGFLVCKDPQRLEQAIRERAR